MSWVCFGVKILVLANCDRVSIDWTLCMGSYDGDARFGLFACLLECSAPICANRANYF